MADARSPLPIAPIVMVALGGCALSMLAATLAIRLHIAGYAARSIGLNAAAAGIAALLVAPFVPYAAARVGAARLLAAALSLAAAALAGFALTASFEAWLALRALEGGCATVLFTLGEYWITAQIADERRGVAIGLYVAAVGAAFASGPLILSALDPRGAGPILAGIALFTAAAAVLAAASPQAPGIAPQRVIGLPRCFAAAPALMLAAALHGAIETAGLNLLPVLAAPAGPTAAALDTSLFILGGGVLQFPIGVLAGRIGRVRMLAALAALAAIGAAGLAAIGSHRSPLFAAGLLLWGGIAGSFYPVGLGELPRRFGEDRLVGANAAFVLSYASGTLIGPPLVGEATDRMPHGGFFVMLALLSLAYFAAAARSLVLAARS